MPQGIASGLIGRSSFQGGAATWILGLALHFFIDFRWLRFTTRLAATSISLRTTGDRAACFTDGFVPSDEPGDSYPCPPSMPVAR